MTDRPENEDSHELVPQQTAGIVRASTSNLAARALELSSDWEKTLFWKPDTGRWRGELTTAANAMSPRGRGLPRFRREHGIV